MTKATFEIQYKTSASLSEIIKAADVNILGIVAYNGNHRPRLPANIPFVAPALSPLTIDAAFEVLLTAAPTTHVCQGSISASCTQAICFGTISIRQTEGTFFETITESAYRNIFKFLAAANYPELLRLWNYIPNITGDEGGMERYRRFNIGRHEAYKQNFAFTVPPVATAVGSREGNLIICFLAARTPAEVIENPRQMSAFNYPARYGPRSPQFSRAAIIHDRYHPCFMISGTASIVGHESQHPDDAAAQVEEALTNVSALIEQAEKSGFSPKAQKWTLKIYIRNPGDFETIRHKIEAYFGAKHRCLYLQADICRPELLLEIEGICMSG